MPPRWKTPGLRQLHQCCRTGGPGQRRSSRDSSRCPGVPARGTVSPSRENAILNVRAGVGPPMMSVPMRSQSGCKSELRIQACKSTGERRPGRHDRLRRRQEQEIAAGHLDLGAEEIVICRQNDRGGEGDGDLDRFAARWSLAMGQVGGLRIDAVHHGVVDREALIQETGAESERSQARIARGVVDFDIGRASSRVKAPARSRTSAVPRCARRPSPWGRRDRPRPRRC